MARTDDEVLRDVVDALAGDVRLRLEDLNVVATHGAVTLRGVAPNYHQRRLAEEVASRIKGVTRVVNELRLGKVPAISDEDLASAVSASIARDSLVPPHLVHVRVEKQRVFLSGQVDHYLARASAEDDARLVEGVRAVVNEIKVVPGPRRPDPDIAGDVRLGLLRELLLGESEIAVTVKDGVVTLDGSVNTIDLRRRAVDLARRTPGVLDVVDSIAVID